MWRCNMDNVLKETCEAKHEGVGKDMGRVETRLNAHSGEIRDMKEVLIKLTAMVEQISRKSIFDKMLIVSVFMMGIVLLVVVLGPELAGKFVGGAVK
jgi:hypothetical protein